MKLKRHLGIIMMTAFMLVISMTMITAAADTTKITFECSPGSVYLLMKMRTVDDLAPNPPREDFSVTGAATCDSFVLYTQPSTDYPYGKTELDCRLFKAGDQMVFDLPDGEYVVSQFFDPAPAMQAPAMHCRITIDSSSSEPIKFSGVESSYIAQSGVDRVFFKVKNVHDYSENDLSSFTEDSRFFINVRNMDGDNLEGIIVNLELENAQGKMEVVERTVSDSQGKAVFTTDISKHNGKAIASVTDSADYVTRAEVDITSFSGSYNLNSIIDGFNQLNINNNIVYDGTGGYHLPQTKDTAYIKQLISEQFSQITPQELDNRLFNGWQNQVLAVKVFASQVVELDEFIRRETPKVPVLKLGNVDKVPIQVKKIDVAGKELPGAQMELFRQKPALQNGQVVQVEESIAQWTSSETAEAFDVTAPGTYRIHEVAAPKGYELAADITFTIDKDGVVQSSTVDSVVTVNGVPTILMEDPKTPPEDPKTPPKDPRTDNPPTGDDNNALAFMLLMALSCAGIAVTDRRIKKYNR